MSIENNLSQDAVSKKISDEPGEAMAAERIDHATRRENRGVYHYQVGEFRITAIHDGEFHFPIQGLVTNVDEKQVAAALESARLSPLALPITFTALVVEGNGKTIVIDTGYGEIGPASAGRFHSQFLAAGFDPKKVDLVLISHLHPDHIGGLYASDGSQIFPNAEIKIPEVEWKFWTSAENRARAPEGMREFFDVVGKILIPQKQRITLYNFGEVTPGITAVDASGHTPGHMAFLLNSGNSSLLILSDVTNHPALFARNPDWSVLFDVDADTARATRYRLLDMASAENLHVSFYHAPFPATGHLIKTRSGYDFVPIQWSI